MEVTASSIEYNNILDTARVGYSEGIELVNRRIAEAVSFGESVIREMCEHIAGSGGKRIRPQLVLYSGLAFSDLNSRMIDAAVAAELIHMASLVHDDIIDESPLRRRKPSINKLWGNHAAVLCGDWLFAQAFGILSKYGLSKSLRYMVEAIQSMCHGEVQQAINKYNLDISIERYYELITGKTARLLECCCKSGAAAGGARSRVIDFTGRYGLNIGLAFQIIDDILDFEGSSSKMGKPKGEDLRQGTITLPVILLLRDDRFGGDARNILSGDKSSEDTIESIQGMLKVSGVTGNAYGIAWSFIDRALGCLDYLPDSESKIMLYNLASSLRLRES